MSKISDADRPWQGDPLATDGGPGPEARPNLNAPIGAPSAISNAALTRAQDHGIPNDGSPGLDAEIPSGPHLSRHSAAGAAGSQNPGAAPNTTSSFQPTPRPQYGAMREEDIGASRGFETATNVASAQLGSTEPTTDGQFLQPRFGALAPTPVCFRHPDRVTYVKCQRCDRPVCPEDIRTAAVGVQCVECVSNAQKAMPARRSILGAKMPGKLWVTYSIIGLCMVSFALQWLTQGRWTNMFAFAPFIGATQPWRFLTAAFLHSTGFIGHIMFNMLAFYQCGQLLERALGHARFAALCVMTALGGSVGFLLLAQSPAVQQGSWYTPVVGASGMVFGLFGALIPILKRAGSSVNQILGLIAINAVLGFVVPGIAWQAHLGGFVVGLAMAYAYAHAPQLTRRRPPSAPTPPDLLRQSGEDPGSEKWRQPRLETTGHPSAIPTIPSVVGSAEPSRGANETTGLPSVEPVETTGLTSAQSQGPNSLGQPKTKLATPTNYTKLVAWALPIAVLAVLALAAYLRYETSGWLHLIRNL